MFPKKGNITQPNNRRPIDIEPWTSKITYEIESEWWYGRVRATLDVDQCIDHMGCKPNIRIDDAFLCLKLFVAKTKYNKISVFILWAWILRVHLIATHMITIMTSELPAASYIKNWPNKKTDSWWLDSYQATHKLQHQKYARGKYICLPYVHLAPFLKQFSKKTLLKRGSGRTIFFWGEMKMGDGRADFSLFPKNPICLGQARAFARKNEIRGCCETITLYGCRPLKQICFCTSATGGLPNDNALPCFMQRIALTTWTAKRGRRNWKPCWVLSQRVFGRCRGVQTCSNQKTF